VDGEQVEIEVAGPEGFITFWVPGGEHAVLVRFEDTPPRKLGWALSALGLAGLVAAVALVPVEQPRGRSDKLGAHGLAWLGSALVCFVLYKVLVLDLIGGGLPYTSPPGEAWPAQNALRADFGQIELLGYDQGRHGVAAGETLTVVLYWRALTPLTENYQSFVHLTDLENLRQVWSQQDHLNPGGLPTTRWPPDKYVWDEFEIVIPSDMPAGEYALNVGLYSLVGGYRVELRDDGGQIVGDSLVIGTVNIEAAD
jgi:hypothetical protein